MDIAGIKVEARTRYWAFNATGKSYIHVKGVNIVAGSVTFENADHCLLEDVNVLYPAPFFDYTSHRSWARNDNTENWLGKSVFMSGSYNTVRDCYIARSWSDGVASQGSHNTIENCLIEDTDWAGIDVGSVSVTGAYQTVRDNTLHRTGTFDTSAPLRPGRDHNQQPYVRLRQRPGRSWGDLLLRYGWIGAQWRKIGNIL